MPSANTGTRKLKPGAARMKAVLNAKPRIVSTANLFPNVSTRRPNVNTTEGVRPREVPMSTMFPGPRGGKRTRRHKK
jgi:hypothetical protein